MNQRIHFILLGGFLGAGKTTAALRLAEHLARQGLRAGFITNDQGRELVDTATLRACGLSTEEIPGGCFCCRFDDLIGATGRLSRMQPPDVLIAEAVGSCTDLAATVAEPLRRLHGDRYTVAPLSALVDPVQARQMLGLETPCGFSDDVRYVFRKQLEEADIIVINKSDLLDQEGLEALRGRLAAEFPSAEVMAASLRNRFQLEVWFQRLLFAEPTSRAPMELDYRRYADGEARLGWLNASLSILAAAPFDADAWLLRLAAEIQTGLRHRAELAHLKLSLQADDSSGRDAAVVNLVRGDFAPELGMRMNREISAAGVRVNLRAQAAPDILEAALQSALARLAHSLTEVRLDQLECFRPAPPVPTHPRIA